MQSQTAETLAGESGRVGGRGDHSLFFEDVNDGGGVKTSGAAQKNGALQQTHVGFGVLAIAAMGALRGHKAKSFPGAQGGRRNTETARHFADAQHASGMRPSR